MVDKVKKSKSYWRCILILISLPAVTKLTWTVGLGAVRFSEIIIWVSIVVPAQATHLVIVGTDKISERGTKREIYVNIFIFPEKLFIFLLQDLLKTYNLQIWLWVLVFLVECFRSEWYISFNQSIFRFSVPRNWDLGVMVAVPLHLQAKRSCEDNILSSNRQRNEWRWEVRKRHPESIHLSV